MNYQNYCSWHIWSRWGSFILEENDRGNKLGDKIFGFEEVKTEEQNVYGSDYSEI